MRAASTRQRACSRPSRVEEHDAIRRRGAPSATGHELEIDVQERRSVEADQEPRRTDVLAGERDEERRRARARSPTRSAITASRAPSSTAITRSRSECSSMASRASEPAAATPAMRGFARRRGTAASRNAACCAGIPMAVPWAACFQGARHDVRLDEVAHPRATARRRSPASPSPPARRRPRCRRSSRASRRWPCADRARRRPLRPSGRGTRRTTRGRGGRRDSAPSASPSR